MTRERESHKDRWPNVSLASVGQARPEPVASQSHGGLNVGRAGRAPRAAPLPAHAPANSMAAPGEPDAAGVRVY
jgi:hypothetical protein